MKRPIFLPAALLVLLAGGAGATPVTLVAHNQRSDSGTLSLLVWDGANAGNAWAIANGVTASTAVWDWNPVTGVLSMTGRFESTSHLGSNPSASAVVDDRVVDLVIDTVNELTTAASYECVEGDFLATVGAHGCANVVTGDNFAYDGSVAYNVGGDANCVNRTIGGDDISAGGPRGLTFADLCDVANPAFNLYTVMMSSNQLILSNGIPMTDPTANWLTFTLADTDGDGMPDITDNCTTFENNTGASAQCDSNGDGYGNRCDGDLNNTGGNVNAQDYAIFRSRLGTVNAEADLNCSGGNVNAQDYAIFRTLLGSPPGPSGYHP